MSIKKINSHPTKVFSTNPQTFLFKKIMSCALLKNVTSPKAGLRCAPPEHRRPLLIGRKVRDVTPFINIRRGPGLRVESAKVCKEARRVEPPDKMLTGLVALQPQLFSSPRGSRTSFSAALCAKKGRFYFASSSGGFFPSAAACSADPPTRRKSSFFFFFGKKGGETMPTSSVEGCLIEIIIGVATLPPLVTAEE